MCGKKRYRRKAQKKGFRRERGRTPASEVRRIRTSEHARAHQPPRPGVRGGGTDTTP